MQDQAQLLKEYIKKRQQSESEPKEEKVKKQKCAKILSVTSGKGGVGKSNFTVNFALELAKSGHKVLIIDADFGLSNVDVILGITPKYDLSHVIRREKHLIEVICDGPYGVEFISGGSGVYDLLALGSEEIDYVLNELLTLDDMVDTIIFDTGAGINENNIQLIGASNEVVLVTTPEPPAIVDAYALAKTLHGTNSTAKIRLVINRAESKDEATKIMGNFINVAENYLKINIEELGFITDDSAVVKSVKAQKPFVIGFPNSHAARDVENIAKKYMEVPISQNSGGLRSFIQKILRK